MSKTEAIETMVKTVLSDNEALSIDDFNDLVNKAQTESEENFYVLIYNYLLKIKQAEVVKDARF